MKQDKFPNGFTSWAETHFEIVSELSRIIHEDEDLIPPTLAFSYTMGGRGALYELAEAWTDEFESSTMHSHGDEDMQLEKIEQFIHNKLNTQTYEA